VSIAALRPCTYPACPKLVHQGRCSDHDRTIRRAVNERRDKPTYRLYGPAWRKYRIAFLRAHPFCMCEKHAGKLVAASIVDHIVPHHGDEMLFWDPENHQSLAKACHDAKTATFDHGFGNASRS